LFKPTSILNQNKVPITTVFESHPEDQSLPTDPEALCSLLESSNLFTIPDRSLIVAAFTKSISRGTVPSIPSENIIIGNKVIGLYHITRKYYLAKGINEYCKKYGLPVTSVIPPTYLLSQDNIDQDLQALIKSVREVQISKGQWENGREYLVPIIVKPGEYFNRGKGISIAYNEKELKSHISALFKEKRKDAKAVCQTYLTNPLLFRRRKFDLRCYCLVTKYFDRMIVYWYKLGYARTSSYDYDEKNKTNMMVHLTNEAVQVQGTLSLPNSDSSTFGKFEPGNKIYYPELEEYFQSENENGVRFSFGQEIVPPIRVVNGVMGRPRRCCRLRRVERRYSRRLMTSDTNCSDTILWLIPKRIHG
jgi:hypothetical protein